MTTTTGVLFFPSGYTRSVSTERSPCLTVTHSRWRGDFSSVALAQSWARVKGEADSVQRTSRPTHVRRFMGVVSPSKVVATLGARRSVAPTKGATPRYAKFE